MQKILTIALLCEILYGCTSMTQTAPTESTPAQTPADVHISISELPLESDKSKLIVPSSQTSPAVMKLLDQAHSATMQGDIPRAEVLLERSIRIEPKNPVLWHYLAKVRLQQGRFNEAAGLAQKSNALAKGDKPLQADNWRIIAHARNRNGDLVGAREAQTNADALR